MALAKRSTGPPVRRENWEEKLEGMLLSRATTFQMTKLELLKPTIQDLIVEMDALHQSGTYQLSIVVGRERLEYAGNTCFPVSFTQKEVCSLIMGKVLSNHERAKFLLKAAEHTGIIQVTLDKILKTALIDYRET